jgi:phytoene/squalene synthetase
LYSGDKFLAAQLTGWTKNAQDHLKMIDGVASVTDAPDRPDAAPPAAGAVTRERGENFPVVLRLLPSRHRARLHTAYALARRIDDVGDDPARSPAERLSDLDALAARLPDLTGGLPVEPFRSLVEANRLDQTVTRYATYADLRRYCELSAHPIGHLVLAVFDADSPAARSLSDRICAALQILEHCQDVVEDLRDRDRVYLPQDDLARFGVDEHDLVAVPTPLRARQVVGTEVDRAADLLAAGLPLLDVLRGWARVAVAGYVAGGLATVDALRRSDFDLAAPADHRRPRRRDVARHALRLLGGRR